VKYGGKQQYVREDQPRYSNNVTPVKHQLFFEYCSPLGRSRTVPLESRSYYPNTRRHIPVDLYLYAYMFVTATKP